MNKSELVAALAAETGLSKKQSGEFLKSYEDIVTRTLQSGDKITIVGFGTFEVTTRKARPGINPRTKEPMKIEASKSVKFRVGKALKDAVNQ